MIRTKKDLIKKLNTIGDLKIKQGIDFKTLALSIEQKKDTKTLKELKEEVKQILQ